MPRGLRAGDCSERGRTQPRWNTRPCAQSQAHLGAVGAVTPEEPGRQPCARSPSQREVSIPVYGGSGSPRPDTCDTRSLSLVTKEPHTRQGHHRVFSSSLTSPGLGTCLALMSFPDQRGLASFLLGAELQTPAAAARRGGGAWGRGTGELIPVRTTGQAGWLGPAQWGQTLKTESEQPGPWG